MNTTVCSSTDKADKGFTLIEVLIALAILSIGILAVASLQVSSRLQSRNSSEITEASAIAYNQMEELMLRPFDHDDLKLESSPYSQSSGKYSVQWAVTVPTFTGFVIQPTIGQAKIIDLTVSWNKMLSSGSNQRQVKFFFIKHGE